MKVSKSVDGNICLTLRGYFLNCYGGGIIFYSQPIGRECKIVLDKETVDEIIKMKGMKDENI